MLTKEQHEAMSNLISKLILNSNNSAKTLKKRIKLTGMFGEFEGKAIVQLMKYIDESTNRYKGMKYGSSIDSMLCRSNDKNALLYEKINEDPLYNSLNLIKEKEYLKTKQLCNSILKSSKLKKELEQCADSFPIIDNNDTEVVQPKQKQPPKRSKVTVNNNKASMKNNSNVLMKSEVSRNKRVSKNISHYNINIVDAIFSNDYQYFERQLLKYKKELGRMKKENRTIDKKKEVKETNAHLKALSSSLSLDNLKMLSYAKKANESKMVKLHKIRSANDIDLNRVIKYTRQYKLTHKEDSIDKTKFNETNKEKDKDIEDNKKKGIEYNDTISLVKFEAKNSLSLNKRFKHKQSLLDHSIKVPKLPSIEKQNSNSKNKANNYNYIGLIDKSILKHKDKNNSINKSIISENDIIGNNDHQSNSNKVIFQRIISPFFITKA